MVLLRFAGHGHWNEQVPWSFVNKADAL